jgi:hypothetical protein
MPQDPNTARHIVAQMRRRQMLALLAAATAARPALSQDAAPGLGVVEAVTGEAFAEATPPRPLLTGAPVHLADVIVTAAAARVSLSFGGGSRIHLGPDARLTIDRFIAEAGGEFTLGAGAMVFDRPEDAPKTDVSVKSVFGLIGVRGTRFFAGPSGGAFGVFVERGALEFRSGDAVRRLGPGEGIDIAAGRVGEFQASRRGLPLAPLPDAGTGGVTADPPAAALAQPALEAPSEVRRWPEDRVAAAFESVLG